MNEPKRRSRIVILVAVVAISAGVGYSLFVRHRNVQHRLIEIATATRQIGLKNRGIGFLENGDYEQADAAFSKLAEQLPGEPLGRRNLAISRLLAIDKSLGSGHTPEEADAAIAKASAAVDDLLKLEPDDAISHLLAAEFAEKSKDRARHADELSAAAELAPKDASVQFKLYAALQYSDDETQRQRAHAALRAAAEFAPENIFILTQWLSVQASAEDPNIADSLKRARRILSPFAAGIEVRARFNVVDAIDKCLAAIETEDWSVVIRNTAGIGNVVRPEPMSHIDRSRIDPHLLEYVIFDFIYIFYDELDLPPPAASPAIDVKFSDAGESLPKLAGVRDLELADFDLDGDLELIVLADAKLSVWKRDAESEAWKSITSFELGPGGARGFVVADLDRDNKETPPRKDNDVRPCLDADIDVIVYGEAGILVLQNKLNPDTGKRTLEPMRQDEALAGIKQVLTAALFDVDHDGDLDLAVSTQAGMSIWSNRDDLTFADISNRSALPPDGVRPTKIVPVDWNRDVAIDLVLGDGETGKVGYLENLMHGSLRWQEFGPDFNLPEKVKSIAVAELDGNASWDLIASGEQQLDSILTTTPGDSQPSQLRQETLGGGDLQHLLTWDYDNDGYRDLLAWNDDAVSLFRGLPDGSFNEASNVLTIAGKQIADCVTGDIDGDGDFDVVAATGDGIALYRNDGGNSNGWIDVSLSADPAKKPSDASKRVNMHGVGSLLELKAGNTYQAQVVTGKSTHFGIGPRERADVLRILWTNGVPENRIDPARNTAICAKQDLKGSCPYLYTWDGEKFAFMTDLLWSAPIGLQFAEGVLAPAREREYLRIPDDKLKETDGEYRLQITEELWEAAYF
ncbi:MAG: hypothetical protein HOH82_01870, partial [Planctomycetaceae bacterium]|nr:hypothetical protein [Planctomycetaceae bacterium]